MGSVCAYKSANLSQTAKRVTVVHREVKPFISLDHRRITLTMRPGSDAKRRADVMHEWHKSLLHNVVPALIEKWDQSLR
jgi:hypothetical protein